jgi:hypothetical protein
LRVVVRVVFRLIGYKLNKWLLRAPMASVKKASVNEEQVAPESLTVRVFGNTAIAIGVIAVKETKSGKSTVHRERFIDTWIYKNGSWVCIATDATPMIHAGLRD